MRGTKQGGSVVNFIIVALVLVGLLVAGFYVVRQVTQNQPSPEETAVEETDQEGSQPVEEVTTEESVNELPGVDSQTKELPKTGSAEVIGGVLAVGMLSLATVYYVRSRRIEWSL